MLTEAEIKAIRDGTEGVTKGPWVARPSDVPGHSAEYEVLAPDGSEVPWSVAEVFDSAGPDLENAQTNAAHIARLDPDTVRELCELALVGLSHEHWLDQVRKQNNAGSPT